MNMKIDEKYAIYLKNGIAANILSINLEEIFHIYIYMYMLYSENATITAHRFKLFNLETAFLLEYSVETLVPH